MANKLRGLVVACAIGGALVVVVGGGASCGDDNNAVSTGGTTGTGGTAGNTATFNTLLTAMNVVPATTSLATSNVTVLLDRTTGVLTVNGNFANLTSDATEAHIHGPAAVGVNAPVLVPLTVTQAASGMVSGNTTMTGPQMNDMMSGMTYVDIHSQVFMDGEIRAQIKP